MVIWQQSTYPISSTVVAKGLCQQDRERKLLLLPPALGTAPDLRGLPSGSRSRVTLSTWAAGMAVTIVGPREKSPR